MYIKISGGNNKGSCANLADYLCKECEDENDASFFTHATHYNESECMLENTADVDTVISTIDNNVQKLSKKDSKFYMLTINPSHNELCNLIGVNKDDLKDSSQLSEAQTAKLENELRKYTQDVMNVYAQNFNRPTIKSGDDLIYYAKIEHERTYKHYHKEVIEGKKRPGDKKEGLNYHIHVIVSRKSADGKVKLSPLAASKGDTFELQGKKVTRGFNYEKFTDESCKHFYSHYYNFEKKSYERKTFSKPNVADKTLNYAKNKLKSNTVGKLKGEIKKGLLAEGNPLKNEQMFVNRSMQLVKLFKSPVKTVVNEALSLITKGL